MSSIPLCLAVFRTSTTVNGPFCSKIFSSTIVMVLQENMLSHQEAAS